MAAPAWAMAETTAAVGFDSNLPRAGSTGSLGGLLAPGATLSGMHYAVRAAAARRPRRRLERRAAKPDPATSTTSSGSRAVFNDGPEARADCTAASAASS